MVTNPGPPNTISKFWKKRLASLDRYSSKLTPWSEQWRTTTAKLRERIGLLERFVYCMLREADRAFSSEYGSFWVEELQISPVYQSKMESVDDLRRALEAARAETAALRAAAEGADRAPRGNDTGDAGEVDSAYRETYDDGYARTRTDGHAGANARQGASTAIFLGW